MFMGIFSIAQRLKAMQLKVVELAVFSAIVLLIGELEFTEFMYSKTCLKPPPKNRQNNKWYLMKVECIAECSPWSIMQYL